MNSNEAWLCHTQKNIVSEHSYLLIWIYSEVTNINCHRDVLKIYAFLHDDIYLFTHLNPVLNPCLMFYSQVLYFIRGQGFVMFFLFHLNVGFNFPWREKEKVAHRNKIAMDNKSKSSCAAYVVLTQVIKSSHNTVKQQWKLCGRHSLSALKTGLLQAKWLTFSFKLAECVCAQYAFTHESWWTD